MATACNQLTLATSRGLRSRVLGFGLDSKRLGELDEAVEAAGRTHGALRTAATDTFRPEATLW